MLSPEIRRPSLSTFDDTIEVHRSEAEVEAYFILVSSKLPVLEFVRTLVHDLADASRPYHFPTDPAKIEGTWREWSESRDSLDEAQRQFGRQLDAIGADLKAISGDLDTSHNESVLGELSESRKLAEIESEDPSRSVTLGATDWDRLTYGLGIVAIVLAVAAIYGVFGVWLTDGLFHHDLLPERTPTWYIVLGVGHWFIVLGPLAYLAWRKWSRATASLGPRKSLRAPALRHETHVFDYTLERLEVIRPGIDALIEKYRNGGMVNVSTKARDVRAAMCSTFRETVAAGIHRTKYSIETEHYDQDISYILHIEVDSEGSGREYLNDVRLVIHAAPFSMDTAKMVEGAHEIIGRCLESLVVVGNTGAEIKDFFRKTLGWAWSP